MASKRDPCVIGTMEMRKMLAHRGLWECEKKPRGCGDMTGGGN